MCGIAGWQWTRTPEDPGRVLKNMADRMVHRGPDDDGYLIGSRAGLAHRRLSIIDLSTGKQPLGNEDGTVQVVFNGEIYNFPDIRKDLIAKGHRMSTQTDTEVLVHLWEDMGPGMLDRLRGMFAFAIYDSKSGDLFVARDRLGVKPVFYAETDDGLFFASEMRSLLAVPSVRPVLDVAALDLYLSLQYVPSPRTIYTTVRKLPPAHFLIAREGRVVRTERYWSISPRPRPVDRQEAKETLRQKMLEATRIRMIADVPLGAFLSGGIDSTITVGLMTRCSDQPIKTFAIGFEESDYSELHHAREAARFHATDHHEFVVKPDALDLLPTLVRHYGEPYADSSAIPTYYLCRETRKHVTVALSGDGGDEGFLGYNRYLAMKFMPALNRIPSILRSAGAGMFSRIRHKRARQVMRLLQMSGRPLLQNYLDVVSHFTPDDRRRLYRPEAASRMPGLAGDGATLAERYLGQWFSADDPPPQAASFLDMHTYLPEDILVKVDIASMANSLETRSAFLDQEVITYAMSLPPDLKLSGLRKKHFLKETFRDLLPPSIQRRGKMGFGVPLEHWFRKDILGFAREVLDKPPGVLGEIFRLEAAREFLDEHVAHRRKNDQRLWNLLFLYTWAKEFPVTDMKLPG